MAPMGSFEAMVDIPDDIDWVRQIITFLIVCTAADVLKHLFDNHIFPTSKLPETWPTFDPGELPFETFDNSF